MDKALLILAGFLAQLIDGTLGMGYGVTSNSLLMAFGLSPRAASSSVHLAELVTTGISALTHRAQRNVAEHIFKRLIIPGMIGGALGAYLLASVLPGDKIKPFVAGYLLLMGVSIIIRALRRQTPAQPHERGLRLLGFFGGLCDAIGGGGWGPIVTTTLVNRGHNPSRAVGTVNTVEFFVTLSQSVIFVLTLGVANLANSFWLIVGGAPAALIGARLTNRLPERLMKILVGILVIILSTRNLWVALH